MLLNLLHLDNALKTQPQFLEACHALNAREVDAQDEGALVRLWGKNNHLETLRKHLASSLLHDGGKETVVTFMGSGDFHHISALLMGMMIEANDAPVTIIHFDNHPDWVHFQGGMHCGSWVNKALKMPQVEKVITIGVTSRDLVRPGFKGANLRAWKKGDIHLFPWKSPNKRFSQMDISAMGEDIFLGMLRSQIKTRNVYITIDKDVLSHHDAITNWDQGKMPLPFLLHTLKFVLGGHHALGIDVTGDYSPIKYAGLGHHVALKKIESLMDQPRYRRLRKKAAIVNQTSNLALLKTIREAV